MVGGKYQKFVDSFFLLSNLKKNFPNFKLRINFTVNEDNIDDLASFFDVFNNINFDILQIRPVYDIGHSEYKNFSWKGIIEKYEQVIEKLKNECNKRKITILYPDIENVDQKINDYNPLINKTSSDIVAFTYFYFKPKYYFKEDYDLQKEDFRQYSKRKKVGYQLFKNIFNRKSKPNKKFLNYKVK